VEFSEAEWPANQFIRDKIDDLKTKQGIWCLKVDLSLIFEKEKVMKHKYLDKYYIGEWNKNGYPEGKGVMLEPESYIYYG